MAVDAVVVGNSSPPTTELVDLTEFLGGLCRCFQEARSSLTTTLQLASMCARNVDRSRRGRPRPVPMDARMASTLEHLEKSLGAGLDEVTAIQGRLNRVCDIVDSRYLLLEMGIDPVDAEADKLDLIALRQDEVHCLTTEGADE